MKPLLCILLLCVMNQAFAHSGNSVTTSPTNKGCHTDQKTGHYHCHS